MGEPSLWRQELPGELITSWVELANAFLDLFFSLSRLLQQGDKIINFFKLNGEPLHEVLQRLNKKLLKCPNYEVSAKMLL